MPAPERNVAAAEPNDVGGPPAFDCFYASEYAAVVRLAFGLTGRLGVAEELAQDAFLAAYKNWDALAAYDSPSAWVRRVVLNRSVSSWRRTATEAGLLARLKRERSVNPTLAEPEDAVWAAIRDLPTRQRQVMVLVVLEDRSVADVAEVLGCSRESIRTHLRRARQRLADVLSERTDSDEP
jgi:RNA polymerase sigma-70 factor (ECF subfamily)